MPRAEKFGLFEDDRKGPLCRALFSDLDEAKSHAQQLADEAGHELFVFCFTCYVEVKRLLPSRKKPQA
jgi:hypothetical protein